MYQYLNFLFTTFLLKTGPAEPEVKCLGSREVLIPDYKTPAPMRGMIEFEGEHIPVVDLSIRFCNRPTDLGNSNCILIVEHMYEWEKLHTGIVIENFDEIMELVAGTFADGGRSEASANMRFVLEMAENKRVSEFLAETHQILEVKEQRKQEERDFALFRQIVLTRSAGGPG